ncbi:MAG TPA: hypothetical protein VET88_03440 [Gammaproteobacteria bacterium]|nr:hypothetical protein [Gammaproteobacteria bacterium]
MADTRGVSGLLPGDITMFGKLINWLKLPVAKVPEEIAVCEFECARQECRLQNWEHCHRRLQARNAQDRNTDQPSC